MKIDRLRVFMSRDKNRPRVILAMDTDEGITGWGECYNHGLTKPCFRCSITWSPFSGARTRAASSF
jgi:L-alanine-DL-glutamate epimerase-like enolase superfamily enzyme